ncbi:hypothetical protein DFH06DRAFT_1145960 [Mycena polygramma]|nr:hypothetical protein DFH06DRAFT_1145960 [Mycena polygramma]
MEGRISKGGMSGRSNGTNRCVARDVGEGSRIDKMGRRSAECIVSRARQQYVHKRTVRMKLCERGHATARIVARQHAMGHGTETCAAPFERGEGTRQGDGGSMARDGLQDASPSCPDRIGSPTVGHADLQVHALPPVHLATPLVPYIGGAPSRSSPLGVELVDDRGGWGWAAGSAVMLYEPESRPPMLRSAASTLRLLHLSSSRAHGSSSQRDPSNASIGSSMRRAPDCLAGKYESSRTPVFHVPIAELDSIPSARPISSSRFYRYALVTTLVPRIGVACRASTSSPSPSRTRRVALADDHVGWGWAGGRAAMTARRQYEPESRAIESVFESRPSLALAAARAKQREHPLYHGRTDDELGRMGSSIAEPGSGRQSGRREYEVDDAQARLVIWEKVSRTSCPRVRNQTSRIRPHLGTMRICSLKAQTSGRAGTGQHPTERVERQGGSEGIGGRGRGRRGGCLMTYLPLILPIGVAVQHAATHLASFPPPSALRPYATEDTRGQRRNTQEGRTKAGTRALDSERAAGKGTSMRRGRARSILRLDMEGLAWPPFIPHLRFAPTAKAYSSAARFPHRGSRASPDYGGGSRKNEGGVVGEGALDHLREYLFRVFPKWTGAVPTPEEMRGQLESTDAQTRRTKEGSTAFERERDRRLGQGISSVMKIGEAAFDRAKAGEGGLSSTCGASAHPIRNATHLPPAAHRILHALRPCAEACKTCPHAVATAGGFEGDPWVAHAPSHTGPESTGAGLTKHRSAVPSSTWRFCPARARRGERGAGRHPVQPLAFWYTLKICANIVIRIHGRNGERLTREAQFGGQKGIARRSTLDAKKTLIPPIHPRTLRERLGVCIPCRVTLLRGEGQWRVDDDLYVQSRPTRDARRSLVRVPRALRCGGRCPKEEPQQPPQRPGSESDCDGPRWTRCEEWLCGRADVSNARKRPDGKGRKSHNESRGPNSNSRRHCGDDDEAKDDSLGDDGMPTAKTEGWRFRGGTD